MNNDRGWICPRCGKVHAPWVPACKCHPPEQKDRPLMHRARYGYVLCCCGDHVAPWAPDYVAVMEWVRRGYATWSKETDRKWVRKIKGTPIENDLLVHIGKSVTQNMGRIFTAEPVGARDGPIQKITKNPIKNPLDTAT